MADDSQDFSSYFEASELLQKDTRLSPGDQVLDFKVLRSDSEFFVKASSSFEAALKTSLVLESSGLLIDNEKLTCQNDESRWTYRVQIEDEAPRVVLESFKRTPRVPGQPIHARESAQAATQIDATEPIQRDLLQEILEKVFGHQTFKPLQKQVISATITGKNVLAIMGTGGGKSLTFMLPAALGTKPTIVISPTRSLIEDLFARSENSGLRSCVFLGGMDGQVLREQARDIHLYRLVFATPEAVDEHLIESLGDDTLERVVFDEAHTICTWGSTFRPKYREVSEKLSKMKAPKLLLSATIPAKVQSELKELFGGADFAWEILAHTVHRENLTLRVKERVSKYLDDLVVYIREKGDESGIIYCVLPKDVSTIHAELLKRDVNCVKYHGQLSEAVKQASYQQWMAGQCKVIVANSSFGMGIDKPDVRYVVHVRLPTSVEDYFQQCGRAGRDGLPADCLLYYSYSDKVTLYKLFDREGRITEQHKSLNELIMTVENLVQCRHKLIMGYFGEDRVDFSCLTKCDNCLSRGSFFFSDGTREALKVVQTVVELGNRKCNTNMLKLILIGSKQKKVQESAFDQLSNFGCLSKKMTSGLLEKFLHLLINEQILSETVEVNRNSFVIRVCLGNKAHDLLASRYTCSKIVPLK